MFNESNTGKNDYLSDKEIAISAENLKKHFERITQRKYSIPRIFSFLEENVFMGYYVTPNFNINDYTDFSKEFDKLLDSTLVKTEKNIIIERFGLFNEKPQTYSEIAYKKNCSVNKIYSVINNALVKIKRNKYYIERIKEFCNFKSKVKSEDEKQKNINYILAIAKELEEGEKYD